MGALTGAAAGLCAGAGLFHFPPLGQWRLVHRLQPETFPFTFVESLRRKIILSRISFQANLSSAWH